jgi:putative nucleotidyltransferase with HDIG domain
MKNMTEHPVDLANRLSAAVDKMPAFPKSVQLVLELSRDDDCPIKELAEVIEKDPVMTVRLLRILNSAYYGFSKQITSVSESVAYVGMNAIKNMALAFAAMGVLPKQNAAGFDVQRLLMHSLITASVARTLCHQYSHDETRPADCYIVGLLHDFGKVVFAQFLAPEFKEALACSRSQSISLHEAEQQIIGTDHAMIGGMLMEKWRFPERLIDSVRRHHGEITTDDMLLSCLYVADQISKELMLEVGDRNLVEKLSPALADRFGGQLHDVIASLGDLAQLEREALVIAQAGDHKLKYRFWGASNQAPLG